MHTKKTHEMTREELEAAVEHLRRENKHLNGDVAAYKAEGDMWRRLMAKRLDVEPEPRPKAPLKVLSVMRAQELSRLNADGRRFRNKKTGDKYYVFDVQYSSEGDMVYAYSPITERGTEVVFSRNKAEFLVKFERFEEEA